MNTILNLYARVFTKKIFYPFHRILFYLSLKGMGVLNYQNDLVSGEYYFINKILAKSITKDSPIFFDVGANIGNYSSLLQSKFPNSIIYAFEPHPENYKALKGIESEHLKTCNFALGSANIAQKLFDRSDYKNGSEHASLYKEVITDIHKKEVREFKISVKTLDSFCKNEKITNIDLLKIDTEGNELEVLKGATNLLKTKKIGIIQFEFNEMNKISKTFIVDFRHILDGYHLYRLLPNDLLEIPQSSVETEIFGFQNIIAIREDKN